MMRGVLSTSPLEVRLGVRPRGQVFSLLLGILFAIGLPQLANAGINTWTTNGPEGGIVSGLVVAPTNSAVVYASSQAGVSRSVNGGGSWTSVLNGLTGGVQSLAVDPTSASTVYAGGVGPVFKTTNAGVSWSAVIVDPGKTVLSIIIDPVSPTTIYAGTVSGIFKSIDGGANWSSVSSGLTNVWSLAIDPSNPATLFAGTQTSVFKSTNGGGSWTAVGAGLTGSGVRSVVLDPLTPTTLYASVGSVFQNPGGLFKSTDGGASWSPINNGLSGGYGVLAIDPQTPSTLYLADSIVFKTTNGGASWSPMGAGIAAADQTYVVAVDPANPSTLYVGTVFGAYKSTNAAGSWTWSSTGLFGTYDFTIVMNPAFPSTLYVGTNASGSHKSVNGGMSWVRMTTPIDEFGWALIAVQALAVDPSNPSTVYASGYCCNALGFAKSTDDGLTWTTPSFFTSGFPQLAPSHSDIVIDPSNSATLYAATRSGVFKSTNGGTNWFSANSGLPNSLTSFLVLDSATSTLYAAAGGVLFRTVDGGGSWSIVSGAPAGVVSFAFDPTNSSILYAGTAVGVSKSLDGGASWFDASTGLSGGVRSIAIVPTFPSTLYAARTPGGRVYRSTNGGASWTSFSVGLPLSAFALDVITDPTGRFIHVATSGSVYHLEIAPDDDDDGVSNLVESGGPNSGDGNNDGIPDSQQARVASVPNAVNGNYVTLTSPAGTTLVGVHSIPNPSPTDAPAGSTFPVGFFEFTVQGVAPGGAVIVSLILPSGVSPTTFYKYGPESGNVLPHWYPFLYDGTTGATIARNVVSLHLVDGRRGDSDLTADGKIVEPGGPAIGPTPSLVALSSARLWFGLKNSDDQGTQFDVRAEVRKNGVLVSESVARCVPNITRNPASAREVTAAFGLFPPTPLATGDVLSLALSARIGTKPDGSGCGGHGSATGLRLYYDSTNRPSRLSAQIAPAAFQDLFLHSDGGSCGSAPSSGVTNRFLSSVAPTSPAAKCKDSAPLKLGGGNPWQDIGTWSATQP